MNKTTRAGISTALAVAVLTVALVMAPATGALAAPGGVHGSPAVSKMTFKLADHNVPLGSPVTGTVVLQTRSGNHWVPVMGAALSIKVDGTQVVTLTTDVAGHAAVSYTSPTAGGHVIAVVYAGDAVHKGCQRSQGFEVAVLSVL